VIVVKKCFSITSPGSPLVFCAS